MTGLILLEGKNFIRPRRAGRFQNTLDIISEEARFVKEAQFYAS
jgi:hypothetical protein